MKLCLNAGDTAVGKDEDWVIWDYTADVDANFWLFNLIQRQILEQ